MVELVEMLYCEDQDVLVLGFRYIHFLSQYNPKMNTAQVELQHWVRWNPPFWKIWSFEGSTPRLDGTNDCLDVTDGGTANCTSLQVWTCVDGARNQQFYH